MILGSGEWFWESWDIDIVNVRIETKIKSHVFKRSYERLYSEWYWMCVTLNYKVNSWGHVTFSNICDILDLENVRIDTKIELISCLKPEIRKVLQKSAEFVHYHRWTPWPRKYTH